MKEKRIAICTRLSSVEDRFKDKALKRIDNLLDDYPVQSAQSWRCAMACDNELLRLIAKPFHILIVEDEVRFAESIEMIIREDFPHAFIRSVHSGGDAIKAIPLGFWHAVFLDINLMDMNGLDLLEKVKRFMQDTKFYVISGYGKDENKERARELGVVEFIDKPFDLQRLIEIVKDISRYASEL